MVFLNLSLMRNWTALYGGTHVRNMVQIAKKIFFKTKLEYSMDNLLQTIWYLNQY